MIVKDYSNLIGIGNNIYPIYIHYISNSVKCQKTLHTQFLINIISDLDKDMQELLKNCVNSYSVRVRGPTNTAESSRVRRAYGAA